MNRIPVLTRPSLLQPLFCASTTTPSSSLHLACSRSATHWHTVITFELESTPSETLTMPEDREKHAHAIVMKKLFDKLVSDGCDFRLLGIWVDGTNKEQEKARRGTRLHEGHVFKIDPTCKFVRGSRKAQTLVFPAMYAPATGRGASKAPPPPPLSELVLTDMSEGSRSVCLEFGNGVCLQVSCVPLSHKFHSLTKRH